MPAEWACQRSCLPRKRSSQVAKSTRDAVRCQECPSPSHITHATHSGTRPASRSAKTQATFQQRLAIQLAEGQQKRRLDLRHPVDRRHLDQQLGVGNRVSEVIGPLPQIAPQKLCALSLWQGGMRRRARPM
jgi:hypothetical protein